MATDVLEDTPEFIERAVGEALTARSISIESFSGLGPEDLCCLTKVPPPNMSQATDYSRPFLFSGLRASMASWRRGFSASLRIVSLGRGV